MSHSQLGNISILAWKILMLKNEPSVFAFCIINLIQSLKRLYYGAI